VKKAAAKKPADQETGSTQSCAEEGRQRLI